MAGTPVDPWSAGLMAFGSIAGGAPPSQTATSGNTVTFDNSGFNVSVGGGTAQSTKTSLPTATQALGAAAGTAASVLSNPLVMIALGMALFLYLKHK